MPTINMLDYITNDILNKNEALGYENSTKVIMKVKEELATLLVA